jgi:hypothetical protein
VNGLTVEAVKHGELQCFVSRSTADISISGLQLRNAALTFHGVLEKIFEQTAIIPFRFPTVLPREPELIAYMAEHSVEYRAALTRLRDVVQMEIKLQFKDSRLLPSLAEPSSSRATDMKPSGREYLQKIRARQEKLEVAAKDLRQACLFFTKGWRQRDSNEGIRCFALVERASVVKFQTQIRTVTLEDDLDARLSGPWPASQFLKEE